MVKLSFPSLRFFRQVSLRTLLVSMTLLAVIFAFWAWPWEEKLPGGPLGEAKPASFVVTHRRDLFWKPRKTGPFRGYDAQGMQIADGVYRDDQLISYRIFDGQEIEEEGREEDGYWVTKNYTRHGRLARIDRTLPQASNAAILVCHETREKRHPKAEDPPDSYRIQRVLKNGALQVEERFDRQDRRQGKYFHRLDNGDTWRAVFKINRRRGCGR